MTTEFGESKLNIRHATDRISNTSTPNAALRMFEAQQRNSVLSPRPSSVSSVQSNASSSSQRGRQGSRRDDEICVGEEVKIAVEIALQRFRLSEELKEYPFPSSLTAIERAYVHRVCATMGLKSKSRGKGSNRFLTIMKKAGTISIGIPATFSLSRNSRQQIQLLVQRFPLNNKERQDLKPRTDRSQFDESMARELNRTTTGRLNNGVAQIPPACGVSEFADFIQTLPVNSMRDEIQTAINDNKVVMISGETGSGKTTQVPQMILDYCCAQKKPCRIFCTQPRRLAALSVAERVASERGEKIGQTVGYQIRLESKVSPKTLLTYCTNGVLLRTLMGGDSALSMVTHVIVDEVHERDRFCDFLLIALREALPKHKNLKLVLMSAALNVSLFASYFGDCPVINVPGTLFDVEDIFLEDILKLTNYRSKEMEKLKLEIPKVFSQQRRLQDWYDQTPPQTAQPDDESSSLRDDDSGLAAAVSDLALDSVSDEVPAEKEELEASLVEEMDKLLTEAWLTGSEEAFTRIVHLILAENISGDYRHSQTSATPLMVAAGRGCFDVVEQLLNMGVNVNVRASNDWRATDWARHFGHGEIVDLLEAHEAAQEHAKDFGSSVNTIVTKPLSEEDAELVNLYQRCFDDDKVDCDLILLLLYKIHSEFADGAILVFLPGYDEIVTLRDRIQEDQRFADSNRYMLFTLHSAMQSSDQRKVFKTLQDGVRKIILSTNLAETSITINDVVYVIDSGKVKEKSYDALTSISMLKCHWISKANALQRRGRAGRCRPGICYHMFSSARYDAMLEFQLPEILRYPLQELCLHTKMLAPSNCPVADFLAKAPNPPPSLLVKNAIHLLKTIDAFDMFEDLTELGHHLADLPLEPRYGKMVLCAVVLKCLDPILTIACTLAYRDPFQLPSIPSRKRAAAAVRKKFASGTHSDHMALLRAFHAWQKAKAEGWERQFSDKNYISMATMEMIVGLRAQLLGQLRASGFVRARGGGDIRDLNTNSENWAVVKAALCAGAYPNLVRVDRQKAQLATMKESKVRFAVMSVLAPQANQRGHAAAVRALPSDWLVFEEMTRVHRLAHVHCCTAVSPITIAVFAGPAKLPVENVAEAESGSHLGEGDGAQRAPDNDSEEEDVDESGRANYKLDDMVQFKVDAEASNLAIQLHQKWHSLFIRRMRMPSKPWSQADEAVIRALVNVLTSEEQALGLQQPAGIGQRPKPMSSESTLSSGGRRLSSCDAADQSDDSTNDQQSGADSQGQGTASTSSSTHSKKQSSCTRAADGGEPSETSSLHSSGSGGGSGNELASEGSSPSSSPKPIDTASGSSVLEQNVFEPIAVQSRYFVMKSNGPRQLDVSQQRGIWATNSYNERRLDRAFKEGKTVYLIFSIHGSGNFQGYAQMTSSFTGEKSREFGGYWNVFRVEWIKRGNVRFSQCQHLSNPWNENKKVQVSRDGQEIEPTVGEGLISLWDSISTGRPADRQNYAAQDEEAARGSPSMMSAAAMTEGRGRPSPSHWGGPMHPPGATYGGPGATYGGHRMPPRGSGGAYPSPAFNPVFVMASNAPPGSYVAQQHSPHQMSSPVMILPRGSHLAAGAQSLSPRPQSPLIASSTTGHAFMPASPNYMAPHGPR